tara:strand:+ start:38279 stop:39961 length:1683 start_codon:yes stop_codon:yes gene_type:complete
MSGFDYIALLLYVVGVFAISVLSAHRIVNQKDMFSAGRQAPWWASGLSGFMTMFSAGTFVVWGGIAYKFGIVAVMINTCYGIAALLAGYLVAGRWNQLGVSTPAEYIQLRFGTTGLHFYTWTMMLKRILGVSVSLYALAVLLVALIPLEPGHPLRDPVTGNLSFSWAVAVFGAIVVIYTMVGGLWAVLMTDVLQFIVLTLVVMMVAVLMMAQIGNPIALAKTLPDGFFLPTTTEYGWLFLAGWVTINFFMVGAEWAFVQRFLAVKSPLDARKSAYLFGVMYLVTPVFWLLPPLLYRGTNPGVNPEQAYILAAQSVLPVGVLGLMFAAMFSATASMVSSQLNVFAGVLTNDFYRRLLNPTASEKRLVTVGRLFTALLGFALVLVAILVPYLGGAEKLIISVNSLLVVPLLAPALWGMFSRSIGVVDMCIVALTSFAIGAAVRFGMSIDDKNMEVLIGVVLPILMLCVIQRLRGRSVNAGWIAVEQQCDAAAPMILGSDEIQSPDPLPAQMVIASLFVCAFGMFALAILSQSGQWIIFTFGAVLLLIAVVIHLSVRRLVSGN